MGYQRRVHGEYTLVTDRERHEGSGAGYLFAGATGGSMGTRN